MYASRSETLISILKYLFYYTLLPVAIYKLLQICKNENSLFIRIEILNTLLWMWNMVILICKLLSYYLQFHKKCNISNSGEQKYISQMFAIDIYV